MHSFIEMYIEGFRNMTVGRKLWAVILIKLAIMFLVFKLFFFPDYLAEKAQTDEGKADVVRRELAGRTGGTDL